MNSKFTLIVGIVGSIIGILIVFKFIFYLFNPSELWTIIIIGLFVFLAYGIQLQVWDEKKHETSWFGLRNESEVAVYEQMTIFGIIPISRQKRRLYVHKTECALFKKAAHLALEFTMNTALKLLPFGGYFAGKSALKALGYEKKAIGS